jgi:recombination protein RecA
MAKKKTEDEIAQAIAAIRKSIPTAFVAEDEEDLGALTTGSIAADAVTMCNGFPRGRITELSGWEASGKTTLSISAAARCQRAGGFVTFLDVEWALDRQYARALGFDTYDETKCLYVQPRTFEEAAEISQTMIQTGRADLVILDSVSALMPEVKDAEEAKVALREAMGNRARMMSVWLPQLVQQARRGTTAVVLINQLREVIHSNPFLAKFGEKTTTSGGKAVRFYSSMRLEATLRRKGSLKRKADDPLTGKEIEVPVGNEHTIKAHKTKVGCAHREAPFWVRYDPTLNYWGIDNIQTLLDMGVASELIEAKSGGYFEYEGQRFKGEETAHKFLLDTPAACEALALKLGVDWSQYAPLREEVPA